MKSKSLPKLTALAIALLALTPVLGSNAERLGAYDFSYQSNGDAKVRPVQVFDDGHSTYFQFRAGEPIPAIFADSANGPTFLTPQNEGPYVKVSAVASGYSLRLGSGMGHVSYQGGGRVGSTESQSTSVSTQSSSLGRLNGVARIINASYREPTQQVVSTETNSYATPLKGDRVEWKEQEQASKDYSIAFLKGHAKLLPASVKALLAVLPAERRTAVFEIVGRDDDTYKEGLPEARAAAISSLLVAHGVSREKIKIKSGVPLETESNVKTKTVTGVTIHWITEAPVRVVQDPTQLILARLMAHKLTAQEAINELSRLQHATEATLPAPPVTPATPATWQILKADANMEAMLKRWAGSSGWTLQWKGVPEVRITGDSKLDRPNFLAAADYVIAQAKGVGYRIKATAYSNKVLVISEATSK